MTEAKGVAMSTFREGWNGAVRQAMTELSTECARDRKMDKYTVDVVIAILLEMHEEPFQFLATASTEAKLNHSIERLKKIREGNKR